MRSIKFPWRQLLALFLAFLVCAALWAEAQQAGLAEQVIRLHVLANSDRPEDQALKLKVRDQVLAQARPLLAEASTARDAAEILGDDLPLLTRAAQQTIRAQGYDDPVQISLEETWFPTRYYDRVALPAGTYQALRVVIGSGEGHNWWCVVFPSLCLPAASRQDLQTSGLSPQQIALISEPSQGYVIRFKTVEWWELLKHRLS